MKIAQKDIKSLIPTKSFSHFPVPYIRKVEYDVHLVMLPMD